MPALSLAPTFTAASLQPAVQSYPVMLINLNAGESTDMRRLRDAYSRNPSYTGRFGIASALLDAIFASGDGNSPKSAFRILSILEEYVVASVLDLKVEGQSLSTEGGYHDVMPMTDPKTGERREIWFDMPAFFGRKMAVRQYLQNRSSPS